MYSCPHCRGQVISPLRKSVALFSRIYCPACRKPARLLHPVFALAYAGFCLVGLTVEATERLGPSLPPPFDLAGGLAIGAAACAVPAAILVKFTRLDPLDDEEIRREIKRDLMQHFWLEFGGLLIIAVALLGYFVLAGRWP